MTKQQINWSQYERKEPQKVDWSQYERKTQGDDWSSFLSKKGATVLSELPDIPANLANLGEACIRWLA